MIVEYYDLKDRNGKNSGNCIIVPPWSKGIRTIDGKIHELLEPGNHYLKTWFKPEGVYIVDMRPALQKTPVSALTRDNILTFLQTVVIYQAEDPLTVINSGIAYNGLEEKIDTKVRSGTRSRVSNLSLNDLMRYPQRLSEDILSDLNTIFQNSGMKVNELILEAIEPPASLIEGLQEIEGARILSKIYGILIDPILVKNQREVDILAQAYVNIANQTKDPATARDVLYLIISQYAPNESQIGRNLRRKMEAEGIGESIQALADKLKMDPKSTHLISALQNMQRTDFFNSVNINDLNRIIGVPQTAQIRTLP